MQNMMPSLLMRHGVNYKIIRHENEVAEARGLPNHEKATSKAYIGFLPQTDIQIDDILINPANEKVYVVDIKTDFFQGTANQLKAFYKTESEYTHSSNDSAHVIFNIGSATGSIIGTGSHQTLNYGATIESIKERVSSETSEDKANMEKIVSLLEMLVNDQLPPSKGLFSKFSETMERHSWLSNSVAAAILGWLTTKI